MPFGFLNLSTIGILGSKKGYDRVSWSFVFLEMPLVFFLHLKQLSFVPASTLTDLPQVLSPLESCVHGASRMPYANRVTWEGTHAYCT